MAKKKAKPVEVYLEREYISKGLKEGWITTQEIGQRNIIIDHSYQQRVDKVDMNHVMALAEERQRQIDRGDGKYLFPIVVFLTPDGKFLLADGFHRVEENRRRQDSPAIMAYVVKVDDWAHEAKIYSCMCNRLALKARNKEDIKKAIETLVLDPVCKEWSDTKIGDHCGVTTGTVSSHRRKIMIQRGIPLPEFTFASTGAKFPYGTEKKDKKARSRLRTDHKPGSSRDRTEYITSLGGKTVHLGYNEDAASKKLESMLETSQVSRSVVRVFSNLSVWVLRRGIYIEGISVKENRLSCISGGFGYGMVLVVADFNGKEKVTEAVGRCLILRQSHGDMSLRMVVVCFPQDDIFSLTGIASKLGSETIEFLTPEELVSKIKGLPQSNETTEEGGENGEGCDEESAA